MWGQRSGLKRFIAIACAAALVALGALGIWSTTRSHSADSAPASVAGAGTAGKTDAARTGTEAPLSPTVANAHRNSDRRIAPSASLPPLGTPLAQMYDELKARADGGDVAAASRLYREVNRCIGAKALPILRASLKGHIEQDLSKMSAEEIADSELMMAREQERLPELEAAASMCADASSEQRQLFPAALRAAQLGDLAATDCFVLGPMLYASGLLDHPEWITQYKQNALVLANAAVERGDWRMVSLLLVAYSQPDFLDTDLFSQVTGTDPAMAYRYSKLMRLGRDPEHASGANDDGLPRSGAFRGLSPEAVAAADAWAEDAYRRYFGGVPRKERATTEYTFCRSGVD
jgi:hypothetical protein